MAARVNLKSPKKAPKIEEAVLELPPETPFVETEDEFGDMQLLGAEEVESERVSKYYLNEVDIEGKSFVDKGEKAVFTLVSLLARNPKFERFNLATFPKKWLHYALGEKGRGREGMLGVLRGKIEVGAPKEPGLPGDNR